MKTNENHQPQNNSTKTKPLKKKTLTTTITTILTLITLDILTKTTFTNKTYFENLPIYIHYTPNFGSSFGIFSNLPNYSLIISIIAILFLIALNLNYKHITSNPLLLTSFIFLNAGIIGNSIDRLLFGYVKDFIGLKHLFIFNLADLYITTAFILLLIYEVGENKSLKK